VTSEGNARASGYFSKPNYRDEMKKKKRFDEKEPR
jgi:hypothetical protein